MSTEVDVNRWCISFGLMRTPDISTILLHKPKCNVRAYLIYIALAKGNGKKNSKYYSLLEALRLEPATFHIPITRLHGCQAVAPRLLKQWRPLVNVSTSITLSSYYVQCYPTTESAALLCLCANISGYSEIGVLSGIWEGWSELMIMFVLFNMSGIC